MKKLKTSLKGDLFVVGIIEITLLAAVILFLLVSVPAQGSNPNTLPPASDPPPFVLAATAPGLPLRIFIPKINVNAAIEPVGLTEDGAVGVPKVYANTAWFNTGPRPGEAGSAIINGHYGWVKGRPAVFNNLHKLRVGDKIYVKDKKNSAISFVVRALRSYGKNDDTAAVFSDNDGEAHLNIITCEGVWDKATKTYSKRLVVFADRE